MRGSAAERRVADSRTLYRYGDINDKISLISMTRSGTGLDSGLGKGSNDAPEHFGTSKLGIEPVTAEDEATGAESLARAQHVIRPSSRCR